MKRAACLSLAVLFLVPLLAAAVSQPPVKRTEQRAACTNRDPLRKPLFGETHSHTSYSFDAVSFATNNPPSEAYLYAKGEPIYITDAAGNPTRCAQLSRPLDWAAITDHSEFFGELKICDTPGLAGYDSPSCVAFRKNPPAESNQWGLGITQVPPAAPDFCGADGSYCRAHSDTLWGNIQSAAAGAYDRTAACRFTSFVGYEWTSMPGYDNRHRNVIFRSEDVPALPLSVIDTGNDERVLWSRLRADCQSRSPNCDVLTIPHNGNLSDGKLYTLPPDANEAYAMQRSAWEPLSEIHQGKGNSECRTGVGTDDPECGFEQLEYHNLDFVDFEGMPQAHSTAAAKDAKPFAPNAFLRNVLKDGLTDEKRLGANPFKFGFAGGTDTHSALPGGTDEGNFQGLHGATTANDEGLMSQVEFNPGALTVAWAEENSRDAIFEALRRRETYTTSGTRPIVRFFAGWDLPADLCGRSDFAQVGYDQGVPMGSDLKPRPANSTGGPHFAVMALKDPGSSPPSPLPAGNCAVYSQGAKLQRIEIVKGWIDATGQHEEVFTVAGSKDLPDNPVDTGTCNVNPAATGNDSLCQVWTDPHFNPADSAFYYARVLENPTCRWSTRTCQSAGLNPLEPMACQTHLAQFSDKPSSPGAPSPHALFSVCCKMKPGPIVAPTEIPQVTQQRAWTSPVWYTPAASAKTNKAKTTKTKVAAKKP